VGSPGVVELEDELAVLHVDLRGHVGGEVAVEAKVVGDAPSVVVEMVEFVTPLQVEGIGVRVPSVVFDPVSLRVPGEG